MPQLTTVDTRGQNVYRNEEGEKEKDRTEGEQRWSIMDLHWKCLPSWHHCMAHVTALWMVVQEEAPLHPSVSLLEAVDRLRLAAQLWTGLYLCVSLLCFICNYSETHKQENGVVAVKLTEQVQQACQQDAGLVPVVIALMDGLVVSLLQEPLSESSLPQLKGLLLRLEAVSEKVNKNDLPLGLLLPVSNGEDRRYEKDSSLKDRFKHICTYLQDRVSSLRSLLQIQHQYELCLAELQLGLQESWKLLENLHTRVTLQPEKCQGYEDPHTVLSDTESMYTQIGVFRNRVHECQTHLNSSTQLFQELESRQQVLAEAVNLTLESTWIKGFLQCNTQQFDAVHENLVSLEQQILTFVTHLRDLRASEEERNISSTDLEHVQSNPSSPISEVAVNSAALLSESPVLDPDPEPPPRSSSRLSAMNCLCGVKRKK
ncbi:uncharacterized protein si:ch211-151h10.2 [Hoplias malabaricus]|uniref:uncharacterized protein si:ch211-151h10.2 n=1 Tax=Hoplias malabaricus TaxID=27720 RepID=UPI003462C5A3